MKRPGFVATAVFVLCFVFSAASFAEQSGMMKRGSGGWGKEGRYASLYDPKKVELLKGEVESIGRVIPEEGMEEGVQILLKTGKETIPVHLGPAWFMDRQDDQFEVNNNVEVKGSRVTVNGKPTVIAQEIKRGEQVLKLRESDGVPQWVAWRMR